MKRIWLSEVIRILEADPEIINSKRKIRVLKLKENLFFGLFGLRKLKTSSEWF